MILTGAEIEREWKNNRIVIEPFTPEQVNPNSYNFRLGRTLRVYRNMPLDARNANAYDELEIPDDGYVLEPGVLYLAHTIEILGSEHYAPIFAARSSVARLGLFIEFLLRGYPRLQPGEETKLLRSRAGKAGSPPGRTGVRLQLPAVRHKLKRLREVFGSADDVELAVRSSGLDEDTEGSSLAGVHHSVLGVRGIEEVIAAVERCWRSYYEAPAVAARVRIGDFDPHPGLAVIVQALVRPRLAGVAFTGLDGAEEGRVVIEYVKGLAVDFLPLLNDSVGESAKRCS